MKMNDCEDFRTILHNFALHHTTMNKLFHSLFCIGTILCAAACHSGTDGLQTEGISQEISSLIDDSGRDVHAQRFDSAMEKALAALDLSRKNNDASGEIRALSTIVGVDIMTSRDANAWETALEAESRARSGGFRKELAGILISKAKLCSYAEISPETGRNDEGLVYAQEALAIAEEVGSAEQQAEACYVIGSLYINKNRWSDPIDQELYRKAGEWIGKGQAIAEAHDIPRLKRNGIMFRSRWYQQGDRDLEAIRYVEHVLSSIEETDYLTASSLNDRLVRLYTRTGEPEKALASHEDYVFQMQKYIQQKQDETLQEMETRFEVQEKERQLERRRYQILLLVLALVLSTLVIAIVAGYLRNVHIRAKELQRLSDSKEQIIEFLSRDIRNPANTMAEEIATLSSSAASLSPDEIRQKCRDLAEQAKVVNTEVADYVGNLLIDRSRKIADIGLSQREIQIIRLSAEGLKATEIADRIFLSVHTVNTHRQRIYSKMSVKNVSDMIRKATELGII